MPEFRLSPPASLSRRSLLFAGPLLSRAKTSVPVLHRTVELDTGETVRLKLSNGDEVELTLLAVDERRDRIRGAMREPCARIRVNGEEIRLVSGNYRLPVAAGGVQIDCPALGGFERNAALNLWRLGKEARFRIWPRGSPLIEPGTFVLPLRRRWLSTATQATNEPVYVDGNDHPSARTIYYHNDVDLGGAEGLEEVHAAAAGLVVSARNEVLEGYGGSPARPRPDVIYIRDGRDWYYRYSHFQRIDNEIRPGVRVEAGQRLGWLGKEGGAGWSHLHIGIQSRQPSGAWGTEDIWPFLWEAAVHEQDLRVIALARPHRLVWVDEEVELDGSLSWSSDGKPLRYEWTLSGGRKAEGARVRVRYDKPGSYSEILKVTDFGGNAAWDFCVVQVLPRPQDSNSATPGSAEKYPPTIHAVSWPTTDLRPGQKITFRVCTFRAREAEETWDFGDGSPPVSVHSRLAPNSLSSASEYGETSHAFSRPGNYIVRVVSRNRRGENAVGHLWVPVRG